MSPIDVHPKRRRPEDIIAEQKRQANASRQQQQARHSPQAPPQPPKAAPAAPANAAPPAANMPAKAATNAPATMAVDNRDVAEKVVDGILQSSISGELAKFDGKEGKFVVSETEQELDNVTDYVVYADDTLWGLIKFHEDGTQPDRHQGLLYSGYVPPPRDSLGDLDEAEWPIGLSGLAEDPWKLQFYLVLQSTATQELITFVTSSTTGRRGVSKLLAHYNRMRRTDPDSYPIVRLQPSGYTHKKFGWIHTPSFRVVGRIRKDLAGAPNTPPPDTSPGGDMSDEIPTFGA